jgi:hypothetical protein
MNPVVSGSYSVILNFPSVTDDFVAAFLLSTGWTFGAPSLDVRSVNV